MSRFGLDASFKGANLSTYGFYVTRFIKPLVGPQDVQLIDIPKTDGYIISSKKFKNNIITIKGLMIGDSHADLITALEDLATFLYSDTYQTLILSNQNDRYYNAQYLDSIEVLREETFAEIDLRFTLNDPFAYDNTATTDTQASFTTNDNTYIVANAGDTYAYPVITITFNAAQTHIYIENNTIPDNRIDITNTFDPADELEIDCKNGTIKLNALADYTGVGDGGGSSAEWIKLAAGNNEIQVGTDDATIDVDIEIEFRKTYLY